MLGSTERLATRQAVQRSLGMARRGEEDGEPLWQARNRLTGLFAAPVLQRLPPRTRPI